MGSSRNAFRYPALWLALIERFGAGDIRVVALPFPSRDAAKSASLRWYGFFRALESSAFHPPYGTSLGDHERVKAAAIRVGRGIVVRVPREEEDGQWLLRIGYADAMPRTVEDALGGRDSTDVLEALLGAVPARYEASPQPPVGPVGMEAPRMPSSPLPDAIASTPLPPSTTIEPEASDASLARLLSTIDIHNEPNDKA